MIELFFKLLVGHALADFALQSDTMAKGKNRHNKPDYIPDGQKFVSCWFYWMGAHSLIHGGVIYLITGSLFFGIFETIAHFLIDFVKCENKINPNQDQLLHLGCRFFYLF
jgi:hypothetical protein